MSNKTKFDTLPAATKAEGAAAYAVSRNQDAQAAAERVEPAREYSQSPVQPTFGTRSRLNPARHFQRSGRSDMASHVMGIITEAIKTYPKEQQELFNNGMFGMIPVDQNVDDLKLSSILGYMNVTGTDGKQHVVAITLILEASVQAGGLGEAVINPNKYGGYAANRLNETITIPFVPSDAYQRSNEYRTVLYQTLQSRFPNAEIHLAGQMTLMSTVNLNSEMSADNYEVDNVIYRLMEAAESQAYELQLIPREARVIYDLATSTTEGLGIEVAVTYPDVQTGRTELGDTFRQNFLIQAIAQQRDNQRQEYGPIVMGSGRTPQTTLSGYVDTIYVGPKLVNNGSYTPQVFSPEANNTASFRGAMVLTMVDTEVDSVSLSQLLFAVMQSSIVVGRNAWTYMLSPDVLNRSGSHFVGALGRSIPVYGQSVNQPYTELNYIGEVPNDAKFDTNAFLQFVQTAVQLDDLLIYLDINESTVNTPALSPVLEAAMSPATTDFQGNTTPAMTTILNALDELFNGTFSKVWAQRGALPLFASSGTRIPLGTYKNAHGETADIREVDNIWMYNNCDDMDTVLEFNNASFSDNPDDSMLRTAKMYRILSRLVPTFKLNGFASRVVVLPEFFAICEICVNQANIALRPAGLIDQYSGMNVSRYVPVNPSYGITQGQGSKMYSGNFHRGGQAGPQASWNNAYGTAFNPYQSR